jgi:farnesyl diphosphate synthase
LLGYQNTIIYGEKIKSKIINNLEKYGSKSKNVNETLNYILKRNK